MKNLLEVLNLLNVLQNNPIFFSSCSYSYRRIHVSCLEIKSVTLSQSENSVFVINDGIAKKIQVEIGEPQGSQIEILSGLSKGDELIIQGNKQLQSGDDVVTQ